jgi:dihydroorotate dehydrogenase (NAD+) catalytic subunit
VITLIQLSNGHKFLFMTASGALGFGGRGWFWEQPLRWIKLFDPTLFTVVTKTVTLNPKRGQNLLRAVRFISGGVVNTLGLGNPGIETLIKKIKATNLIISIAGNNQELVEMIQKLNELNLIKGIELNVSCPNLKYDITTPQSIINLIEACELASKNSRHPLILKISPAQPYILIAQAVREMGIEAFSINSTPWNKIHPNQKSPLEKLGGGGVSGKPTQSLVLKMIRELHHHSPIPIIGSGVWDYGDIFTLLNAGASAVSFGSIFLRYPWRPTLYVRKYPKQ